MKQFCLTFFIILTFFSCEKKETFIPRNFSAVEIATLYSDTLLSVRATEILNDKRLAFAANNGVFGLSTQSQAK